MIFPAEHLFDKMAQDGSFSKDSINLVLNGGSGISYRCFKINFKLTAVLQPVTGLILLQVPAICTAKILIMPSNT